MWSPVLVRRALAVSVALLCVAVQGSSIAHLLLTRHAVCPEHGELVHADPHSFAGSAHRGLARATGLALGTAPDLNASEHSDEHCAVLASPREYAVVPPPARQLIAPADDDDAALLARAAPQPDGRERYDVAPKQSPPV